MKTQFVVVALLAGVIVAASAEPRPAGIGERITLDGPVFTNAQGMTLYWRMPACNDDHTSPVAPISPEGAVKFKVTVPRVRSCLQKNPPLLAPASAKPTGKWTVFVRENGIRQWAYDGKPIHTSIKDVRPGDINGNYPTRLGRGYSHTAAAPLDGAPSGISWRITASGLALTDMTGRSLYFNDGADCVGSCTDAWQPFAAAALASTARLSKSWSIVVRTDGARQWAYNGHPLYAYAHDTSRNSEQVFGDTYGSTWAPIIKGWNVALLLAAPRTPSGLTIQSLAGDPELFSFGLPVTVYADSRGHTLYTMHCSEGSIDGGDDGTVACDDVGDDPRYWLAFCGGETRCAATWHPLLAPAGAREIDDAWSVVIIDPGNPFRTPDQGKGVRVWAYHGRPVFTYAHDTLPGDYYGDDNGFGTTGLGQMQARPIPAFGHPPFAKPVVALTRN